MEEIQILRRKLAREKLAREKLENMIEDRTRELFLANEKIGKERILSQQYFDVAGVILVVINADQTVRQINQKGCENLLTALLVCVEHVRQLVNATSQVEFLGNYLKLRCSYSIMGHELFRSISGKVSNRMEMPRKKLRERSRLELAGGGPCCLIYQLGAIWRNYDVQGTK